MATTDEDRERRRASIQAAFEQVTTGPRVDVGRGITIPEPIVARLSATHAA